MSVTDTIRMFQWGISQKPRQNAKPCTSHKQCILLHCIISTYIYICGSQKYFSSTFLKDKNFKVRKVVIPKMRFRNLASLYLPRGQRRNLCQIAINSHLLQHTRKGIESHLSQFSASMGALWKSRGWQRTPFSIFFGQYYLKTQKALIKFTTV